MNITENRNDNTLTLLIEGRIDTATAPKLEQVMQSALDGVTELFLDLKDTVYISSAGLRVLLAAQKQMNKQGNMTIIHANADLMEILCSSIGSALPSNRLKYTRSLTLSLSVTSDRKFQ